MVKLEVKRLETLIEKSIGLIGRQKAHPVMFETRLGIHTFFLKFPIDVIILNKQGKVVAFKEALSPNRIFLWNPRYRTVLELPVGTIKKHNIQKGTTIETGL
ncbi:MAG: DUF192 domain-containing protein [Patescibacteria group bacterium]